MLKIKMPNYIIYNLSLSEIEYYEKNKTIKIYQLPRAVSRYKIDDRFIVNSRGYMEYWIIYKARYINLRKLRLILDAESQ